MKRNWVFESVVALGLWASPAHALVLYDGSLGFTLDQQGWMSYGDIDFFNNYHVNDIGQTRLNTLSSDFVQAGFSNHLVNGQIVNASFPSLDRNVGFVISFTVKVSSEAHASTDRAGFSVIALGSDAKGIEIGFWGNEIFAQNGGTSPGLFTHGESATFDTTAGFAAYDLLIRASSYELKSKGELILTGSIRDYSAFVPPLPVADPYEIPNYIFLGDDTTSARADITTNYVSVTVPEPPAGGVLCVAGMALVRRRSRRD